MSSTAQSSSVEEVKTATISVEKVRELIEDKLNKDLDAHTDALTEKELVKTYRRYKQQLSMKDRKVTEYTVDEHGNKVKKMKTVPVLDKDGNQVFVTRVDKNDPKKKKIQVAATKEVVVSHPMTPEEVEEREKFLAENRAAYKTITKECAAYNEHRTSLSKRGVKYFNEFLKNTAVNLLIKAGEYVDEANLAAVATSGARLPEKPKITMADLASCDYMNVSGIKVFITPSFGQAVRDALKAKEEELSELVAKKIKKSLKSEGYVKNDTIKRQEAAKRKKEKAEKERADLAKYAGKTYEEVLALKEQEKKQKAEERKASKKKDEEKTKKSSPKYIFANAIKRAFKDATKTAEGKSRYSVASPVLAFFENACLIACDEIANAAHFFCRREKVTIYNTDEMIHHIGILHGGSISVNAEFSSYLKTVPKADELERLRKENKERRDAGEVVANINKSTLPTEEVVAVKAVFKYSGEGAEFYTDIMAQDELYKQERKAAAKAKKGLQEEEQQQSTPKEEPQEEPKKKPKKKKVQVIQEESDDEEEEVQQVITKKK